MNRKFGALVLCLLLSVSLILGACGNAQAPAEEAGSGTDAEYVVKVVDGSGNPYTSGVIVQFMKNGEKVALQTIDANGVAAKTMAKGDYTVELMFTGNADEYFYEKEGLTLSATQTTLEVVLAQAVTSQAQTLYVGGSEYNAYSVTAGSTHVKLTAGERNYFLFTPTVAGTYEFSVSDATAQLGYYGAPHFVQSMNAAEMVDGKFTVSIKAHMIGTDNTGTSVLVLGIDAGENDNCVLTIERIGEPQWDPSDEPWQVYQPTVELQNYTLPAGANLMKFDITASTDTYKLVLNETDGFYHLNDANGPLVLMYLGEDVQYLDCFKTILDHTGVNRYFFDENGEFLRKESYGECLLQYIACMDETKGVYPLTEDLKYILQMEGEDAGWFDTNNSLYLFNDDNGNFVDGINNEISWLFMCCYIAN
jgi:hypothetical protein